MKIITRILAAGLVALALVGCAAGPKFSEVSSKIPAVPADSGRVYVYRTAIVGAAVQPDVKIDGKVVGKAVPQGFFYVDLPAGNHEIVTSTEVDRKLSLTLDKGQTRYVRLDIGLGFFVGHIYPKLVDPAVGAKEIQECSVASK